MDTYNSVKHRFFRDLTDFSEFVYYIFLRVTELFGRVTEFVYQQQHRKAVEILSLFIKKTRRSASH